MTEPQDPVVVEAVVNAEKLGELLAVGTETRSLDYKKAWDLQSTEGKVELAKDVAAMTAFGGYLVVGVDGAGTPTAQVTQAHADLFDEARLRPILEKYLPPPVNVLTATHRVGANQLVVLVYVAPHPDGFTVLNRDGAYRKPGDARETVVFQPGDVFIRRGTSSERWRASDLPAVLARRDQRMREEARQDFAATVSALGRSQQGQDIALGSAAAYTYELDEDTFNSATVELLRRRDLIPIRLLLNRIIGDAPAAAATGDHTRLSLILDRLTSLTATALTVDDSPAFQLALGATQRIYNAGFVSDEQPQRTWQTPPEQFWWELVTRLEALGALALRLDNLQASRAIALHPVARYASWFRHASVNAAWTGQHNQPDGTDRPGSLIGFARTHIYRLAALRPDRPDDSSHNPEPGIAPATHDMLLDSLCQYDLLWNLAAVVAGGRRGTHDFYTAFAAYYSHRTEPLALRLIQDHQAREAILNTSDDTTLREALANVLYMATHEGWRILNRP